MVKYGYKDAIGYSLAIKSNETLIYATTLIDFEDMLTEISWTQKDKYLMNPLICSISNRHIHTDRK